MADSQHSPAMKPKRLFRRVVFAGLVAALIPSILLATVIVSPQICFAYSENFGAVTVYSDQPITQDWGEVLKQANAIVETSELMSDDIRLSVFLVRGTTYAAIQNRMAKPVMAKASGNRIFLDAAIDWESKTLVGPVLSMNLVRTLAHEMTHCIENQRFGTVSASSTALWKREGYAEYIAHSDDRRRPHYQLSHVWGRVAHQDEDNTQWVDLHDGIMLPPQYLRYRIAVEFLIEQKGMSYAEIVEIENVFDDVLAEATEWIEGSEKGR